MAAEKNLLEAATFHSHCDHFDSGDVTSSATEWICPQPRLSSVEIEVLRGIAEGLSDAQVAAVLCKSPHTIRSHRDNLLNKIGASNRVELTRFAIAMGHVPPTWRGMSYGRPSESPWMDNTPRLRRASNASDTRTSTSLTAQTASGS